MEEKELWMNKLKEKLGDYSEPLPASGWEQLEKELMPPVERKIYPYRKWTVAAAAVILLALVSSLSLYFLGTPAAGVSLCSGYFAGCTATGCDRNNGRAGSTSGSEGSHSEGGTEYSTTDSKCRCTCSERKTGSFGSGS